MKRIVRILLPITTGILAAVVAITLFEGGPRALAQLAQRPFTDPDTVQTSQPYVDIDQEVESAGITVRLVGAHYSSMDTRLVLELHHPSVARTNLGQLFKPIFPDEVTVSGLADNAIQDQTLGVGNGGIEKRELVFGPIADPEATVTVEISILCLERANGGPCEGRQGSWRFEFVPGVDAVDPINEVFEVNVTSTDRGAAFSVDRVQLSSSGMLVFYSLEGGSKDLTPLAPLEAVYPDGTIIPGGRKTSNSTSSLIAIFPPPPSDAATVTFRMNSVAEDTGQELDVGVSLQGKLGNANLDDPDGTTIPLNEVVSVGGEAYLLESVEVGRGLFTLHVKGSDVGEGTAMVVGPETEISLVDSEGRMHRPRTVIANFSKDTNGLISGGRETFIFTDVVISSLESFKLVSTSHAVLIQGPWEVSVELP